MPGPGPRPGGGHGGPRPGGNHGGPRPGGGHGGPRPGGIGRRGPRPPRGRRGCIIPIAVFFVTATITATAILLIV